MVVAGVAGDVLSQSHNLSRPRPEGVSLGAPGARESQAFPQTQEADLKAGLVRKPADWNPVPQERLRFLTIDPRMSMKTKEPVKKPANPDRSFSTEGNCRPSRQTWRGWGGVPSSHEEARGGGPLRPLRALRLGVKPGLCHQEFDERSGNVYENKGPAREPTTHDPSSSK